MTDTWTTNSSLVIHAPIEKVWDALINPTLIKQYLFGSEVVSDWKEGSSVTYKGNYQGKTFEDKGKVIKFDPQKQLILTHWSPLSGTPDLPKNYHTVTYTLDVAERGIHVTITQNNCSSEDEKNKNKQFWTLILQGMKKLLEN